MNEEKVQLDIESIRRKKLISVQKQLQLIWDRIDQKMWFGPQGKRTEIEIQRLWSQFENLEVQEHDLLRTGSMMAKCYICRSDVWNNKWFINGIPFCRTCY